MCSSKHLAWSTTDHTTARSHLKWMGKAIAKRCQGFTKQLCQEMTQERTTRRGIRMVYAFIFENHVGFTRTSTKKYLNNVMLASYSCTQHSWQESMYLPYIVFPHRITEIAKNHRSNKAFSWSRRIDSTSCQVEPSKKKRKWRGIDVVFSSNLNNTLQFILRQLFWNQKNEQITNSLFLSKVYRWYHSYRTMGVLDKLF